MTPEQKERAEWRRENATIRVARLDDLKKEQDPQKKAAGRHKDLGDVETIEHMMKNRGGNDF